MAIILIFTNISRLWTRPDCYLFRTAKGAGLRIGPYPETAIGSGNVKGASMAHSIQLMQCFVSSTAGNNRKK